MKGKRWGSLLLLLFVSLLITPYSQAKDSVIHNLEINIRLEDNGDALVEEIWEAEIYQGTEVFLVKDNLTENQMDFTDLQVKDERGKEFSLLDTWDTSASRAEKAYKAGYNYTSSGVELCFGIGDYGSHTYHIRYRVKNFLVGYGDGVPGFHVRLINDKMSAPIEKMKISLEKPGIFLSQDNAKIWSFGYKGDLRFQDGKIVATSQEALGSRNYVNIMASFSPELFQPRFTNEKTFEQVKEQAFRGSDYDGSKGTTIAGKKFFSFPPGIFFFIFAMILFSILSGLIQTANKKRGLKTKSRLSKASIKAVKRKIQSSSQDYERDIPFQGDLLGTYGMLNFMGKAKLNHLISALILQWMKKGYIHLIREEQTSFFGLRTKEVSSIGGLEENPPPDPLELKLYNMMKSASGRDLILQEKEFYQWSKQKFSRILSWHSSYVNQAEKALEKRQELGPKIKKKNRKIFFREERDITEKGLERIGELVGLEHFLKEFTLIAQREAVEVALWEDYLIYGALLGIADQVAENLEKLQPGIFQDSVYGRDFSNTLMTLHMANSMSHAMTSGTFRGSSASSGGGGSSSFGGGGGFSGGGSGGGFR